MLWHRRETRRPTEKTKLNLRTGRNLPTRPILAVKPPYDLMNYGYVGREFKLRPFSAGSILTLRNRIEPLASATSVERTPRKIQSTKLTPSITAPGTGDPHHPGTGVASDISRLTLCTTGL